MRQRPPTQRPTIPPNRVDGTISFVHRALTWTGALGRISPWAFLPLWLALTALTA